MSSGIDWPGLLKWSLHYNDGTTNAEAKPMSEEKKEFLEKALQQYYGTMKDPHAACKEALEMIDANNVDATMGALHVIRDLTVEHPELARNFAKIGAANKLLECLTLKSTYSIPVVVLVLRILSDVSQNNPSLQSALVELGAVRTLCGILKETSEKLITLKQELKNDDLPSDEKADKESLIGALTDKRSRAMSCLSNIIRHNKKAETSFANQGGLTWIKFALQQRDPKFMETSLLLLFHLLAEQTIKADVLLAQDRPGKKSSTCMFMVLMQKMLTHDMSAGPHQGELFTQTITALWKNGGSQLPPDAISMLIETLTKKRDIIAQKIENEKTKPDGEYHDDYSYDYNSITTLLSTIKQETGLPN